MVIDELKRSARVWRIVVYVTVEAVLVCCEGERSDVMCCVPLYPES